MSAAANQAAAARRNLILSYGGVLVLVGLASVVLAGMQHWTALIPAILGGITLLVGVALRGVAATIGALVVAGVALVGTASAVPLLPAALSGGEGLANPAAVIARAATAIATGLFLGLLALAAMRARRAIGG